MWALKPWKKFLLRKRGEFHRKKIEVKSHGMKTTSVLEKHLMFVQWTKAFSSYVFCNINFDLTSLSSSPQWRLKCENAFLWGKQENHKEFRQKHDEWKRGNEISASFQCDDAVTMRRERRYSHDTIHKSSNFLVEGDQFNNLLIMKRKTEEKKNTEKFLIWCSHLIQFRCFVVVCFFVFRRRISVT